MEGAKDFLMEEQAVPGDDEGLQRQLDQCSVSPADLGNLPLQITCSFPLLFAAIIDKVRI